MYNRLYNHLVNKKYYTQSSSASESHSTEHAIIHLVNQIYESIENDNYILEFFIYWSKAFDTADYARRKAGRLWN